MRPIEELGSLLEKFKANGKLSRPDVQQVQETLVEGFRTEDNWSGLIPYLFDYPAEVSARAFVLYWEMNDSPNSREKFFNAYTTAMQGAPKYTVRGLTTARELLRVNVPFAFRLFCDACEKATDGGKKFPVSKLLDVVKGMCVSGELNSIDPDTVYVTDLDFTALSVVIVPALSLRSTPQNSVLDTVSWLKRFGRRADVSASMIKEITESTLTWNGTEKQILQDMGMSFIRDKPTADGSPEADGSDKSRTQGASGDKIFSIDSILSPIKKYLIEAQNNTTAARQDLARQLENLRLENKERQKAEQRVAVLQEQVEQLQLEVRHLMNTNNTLEIQVLDMSKKLKQEEERHSNEVERLIDMSEHETTFVAQEFKNKLAKLLRTEYLDFAEVHEEPMSVELGENIRIQLHNVFSILRGLGINIQ